METQGSSYFSRKQIWTLFLISLVPVHLWTILMLFRDYSWVVEDFSLDIYLGYVGYALVTAFVESLIAAVALLLAGLLISKKWPESKRIVLHGVVLLSVSLWAAGNQIFFLLLEEPPVWFSWFMLRVPYHQTLVYYSLVGMVVASVGLPVFLVLRFQKVENALVQLFDRLTVLAVFYLGLDLLGFLFVAYRLIKGDL
ncbi:MAG TPA: hypothetical protein ENO25_03245 [Desulfobacteraceae bacterium]|nr:hypothetical protein [Desulfobacteraceae bacterium]